MSSRSTSIRRYAPPRPALPSSEMPAGRRRSTLMTSQPSAARQATVERPSLPELSEENALDEPRTA